MAHYYEIPAGGGKVGVFAAGLDSAKVEVARLVAEYCPDPDNCTKQHYHDINCRCIDCFEAEENV